MIDTHAHLDDDAAAVLARARAAGVTRVVAVGTDVEDARRTLELAEEHDDVFCAAGIHPHEAAGVDVGAVAELRELLRHECAVAVGETGLDFFRDYAPRDAQQRLLAAQLELAADLAKPVVIHSRAADDEIADALDGYPGTVVLHCFSSPHLLPLAVERGYYVSFAGNVTYKNASDLRVAASQVPAHLLLAETDAPYLAPQPVRGKRNEPAYVIHTYDALACARDVPREELEAQIDANACAAFALP